MAKAPGGRSYTFTCTPVTEGDNAGVLVFATDVTDHAEASERLRASERRRREAAVTLQRSLLPQELEQPEDNSPAPPPPVRIATPTVHPLNTSCSSRSPRACLIPTNPVGKLGKPR